MRNKRLILMGFLSLALPSIAQANVTPANDDGGGNVIFFDRHQLNCGYQGIQSMRLFRPQSWQISFDYQCYDIGETSTSDRATPPNDDGAGNMVFLDRHGVDCGDKAIQFVQLGRPSSNQISYHYKCGNKTLANVQDYYTPANDDGAGNAVYLDRHKVACPANQVLSYFRLQRPSGNTVNYHYRCGEVFKEIKMNGKCLDGTFSALNDNVYLHDCHGGDNQKWFMDNQGLIHIKANQGLCVDVAQPGYLYDGADARLNTCNGGSASQRFNYQDGRLKILDNGAVYCLNKPLFSSNINYTYCSPFSSQIFSFDDGSTLTNVDPFNYLADLMGSNTVREFAAAFQIDDFKIQHLDLHGTTTITGRIRNMDNGNSLGLALEAAVGMRKYLVNDNRNDVPVTVTLTNQGNNNFEAKMKLELVRGWLEVNTNNLFGTQMILKDADVVLTAKIENGQKTRTIGVDGAVYIKPTSLDNWLYTNPSVERQLGPDPSTDLGIVIKGACYGTPNQNTNGDSECNSDWNVMNAQILKAYSEANGGYNYLQVTIIGGQPVAGKVVIQRGSFLSTADVSGQWEGDEDGSRGKANIQLNGLDNKVKQVISENDFTSLTNYAMFDAYHVDKVYITKESNSTPAKIHAMVNVMGEDIHVIYTPQSSALSYYESAQANEDLAKAVAEAIGRVIANKTGLGKLMTLVNDGLEVIGLSGGASIFYSAAGEVFNTAQDAFNGAVDVICGSWNPLC